MGPSFESVSPPRPGCHQIIVYPSRFPTIDIANPVVRDLHITFRTVTAVSRSPIMFIFMYYDI